MPSKPKSSLPLADSLPLPHHDDDDDFQIPLSQSQQAFTVASTSRKPLKPSNNSHRPPKKPKRSNNPGKENVAPNNSIPNRKTPSDTDEELKLYENCSLDLIESSIDFSHRNINVDDDEHCQDRSFETKSGKGKEGLEVNVGYLCNSIEARLMRSGVDPGVNPVEHGLNEADGLEDFDEDGQLDVLIKLCTDDSREESKVTSGMDLGGCLVQCPLCGIDISDLSEESRLVHTNDCLDKEEKNAQEVASAKNDGATDLAPQVDDVLVHSPGQVVDVSPVLKWLQNLGLERYEEAFVREEIDWESLKWLTEEDLFSIGVTALGPRKKIVHALAELRKGCNLVAETHRDTHASVEVGSCSIHGAEMQVGASKVIGDVTSKPAANKLITDYFPGTVNVRKKLGTLSTKKQGLAKRHQDYANKCVVKNHPVNIKKLKDIPLWCTIPGTPFRVDAFKYLRGDCAHWFLTHFHMDHYQGLTRSFCHGKIYCSLITARLVNMKIGIPWDKLQILPLNQTINIAGIDVTCLDANHCSGSIIILFEPPNVLHTGDFRFCEKMASMIALQRCHIHTLILDTTYCNPQYDFPKQEAVIQFVIEAIQAESFNPKTLFLIGSYTIGKERLFLEVAQLLKRKVHVTAAKFRLLECLGLSKEDMQWLTLNEQESQIHVVPMWTLASFKRLKHISNQYAGRFSLTVAFSPTGWTFGKGKKKSPGRRWQQGTIIRYEVPYSEHCSFTELREFVKFVSPEKIIPSVNNDGPDSADTMVSLLLS
ncbi:uncharacterized protein LOC110662260 isoform X2 [Hevea brasiliensis]|uniref:uncharacterized protein LOC110662260 isoform X2 n=1 Tax=Hevea brasiliensis TaxID=3981 RepID=UPI0025E143EE|nr:uncharacterized protein LOC110662260 isoform X2 [Hevea brasiliensis]